MKKNFVLDNIIVPLVFAGGMITFVSFSLDSCEREECERLETFSKEYNEYNDFFLTDRQKKQCDRWGVEINAPVKK